MRLILVDSTLIPNLFLHCHDHLTSVAIGPPHGEKREALGSVRYSSAGEAVTKESLYRSPERSVARDEQNKLKGQERHSRK